MNTVLWVIAVVLAVVFLASGLMKLTRSRSQLTESGMGWAADWTDRNVKLIGALEILAAIGLILPPVLGIAPVLAPLAALGLALIMIGAMVVHARRHEYPVLVVNVILLALAVVVVVGRFGPDSF